MSEEIKPCPFDGGIGIMSDVYDGYPDKQYFIVCVSCAAEGPWEKTRAGALRGWNTRVNEPAEKASE